MLTSNDSNEQQTNLVERVSIMSDTIFSTTLHTVDPKNSQEIFVGVFKTVALVDFGVRFALRTMLDKKLSHVNNSEIVPPLPLVITTEYHEVPVAQAVWQPTLGTWTYINYLLRVRPVVVLSTEQDVRNYLGNETPEFSK